MPNDPHLISERKTHERCHLRTGRAFIGFFISYIFSIDDENDELENMLVISMIMKVVIRKCGIDAAPAMVGWDFSGGGAHPVYDGVVVCQENAEALMDAWNQEQEIQAKRAEEKREKRVLDNWKKLVKGLIIKQRIKSKYMKE